jgi:hypothetical protein
MRARLVEFERGIDPKEAMNIGRLSNIPMEKIHNAAACAKNYSFDDLENIYKRVRAKNNIKLDGVPVENLSYNDWVTFNNKVVNGIKALRRKKTKSEFKFSEGELIKADYEGKTYFGRYKGVDRNGRIQAIGHQTKLSFSPERFTKATQEEIEAFLEQGIAIEKRRRKSQIKHLQWRLDQAPNSVFLKTELEMAIRNYENSFKEKYQE